MLREVYKCAGSGNKLNVIHASRKHYTKATQGYGNYWIAFSDKHSKLKLPTTVRRDINNSPFVAQTGSKHAINSRVAIGGSFHAISDKCATSMANGCSLLLFYTFALC